MLEMIEKVGGVHAGLGGNESQISPFEIFSLLQEGLAGSLVQGVCKTTSKIEPGWMSSPSHCGETPLSQAPHVLV
jgi:hypothetical protein